MIKQLKQKARSHVSATKTGLIAIVVSCNLLVFAGVSFAGTVTITEGQALQGNIPDAFDTSICTITYNPSLSTVWPVGTHTLSAHCTPKDPTKYDSADATLTVVVQAKATTPPPTTTPTTPTTTPTTTKPTQTVKNPTSYIPTRPTTTTTPTPVVTTTPAPTPTSILITDIVLAKTGRDSVTLSWKTNVATKGTLSYGLDTSYGQTQSESTSTTDHSLALPAGSLQPGTSYNAMISASDDKGNKGDSANFKFRTTGYLVNVRVVGLDGKPVPAGASVKFGDLEAQTTDAGIAYFTDAPAGSQSVSYTVGSVTGQATIEVQTNNGELPQDFTVTANYGKAAKKTGSIILIIGGLLLVLLLVFFLIFWLLKRRNNDGGDETGGYDPEEFFQTYNNTYGNPTNPEQPTDQSYTQSYDQPNNNQYMPPTPAAPAMPEAPMPPAVPTTEPQPQTPYEAPVPGDVYAPAPPQTPTDPFNPQAPPPIQ